MATEWRRERSDPRSRAFGPNRQREGERGALAQLALNSKPTPGHLMYLRGHVPGGPRPLLPSGVVPADLTELLEDRRLILRRDPDPRVADGNRGDIRGRRGGEADPARLRCELHGIGQEV